MTTPVIIDVIMAVVLIAAVIYGAHRGLFRALAGLAVVIVALVGAAIIANTLAAPAARLVTPLIREQIETKVDEAMARGRPRRSRCRRRTWTRASPSRTCWP